MENDLQTVHGVTVTIVGAGHVGSTFAYSLLLSGLAEEIVLIDQDHARAEGEAMDIAHAVALERPTRVRAARLEDAPAAAITVITAGVAQRPGETRLDLVQRNLAIFRELVPRLAQRSPDGILLVATNPVDVMTWVTLQLSGLDPRRVFGSGTVLDTARLRALLSERYQVDSRSIHAHVIGEHGDSEVVAWSLANVAGTALTEFCASRGMKCDAATMNEIVEETRGAAGAIIERKGSTAYAIGSALTRIVEAIIRNERSVLSVSSVLTGTFGIKDVCLSLPSVVARSGIVHVIEPSLAPQELHALRESAAVLQKTIATITL